MVRDNKRLFDEIGQIALPYLIYAENETFRMNLAKGLARITHNYLRQSDMQLFPNAIDGIKDMIEEYRITAGTENIQIIDMMAAEISTLEDRFILLSEKMDAHIKSHKQRPKASEAEPGPDDRFKVIKEIIEQTGNVSYKDLMSRFCLTKPVAQQLMSGWVSMGQLKNIGNRRVPIYVIMKSTPISDISDNSSATNDNSSAINDNSSAINDNIKEMALPIVDNPRMKDEVAAIKKILVEQNPDFIKNIEVQEILKERFHYTICDTRTASEIVKYLNPRASKILTKLVNDGWAVREGKTCNTRYKITIGDEPVL